MRRVLLAVCIAAIAVLPLGVAWAQAKKYPMYCTQTGDLGGKTTRFFSGIFLADSYNRQDIQRDFDRYLKRRYGELKSDYAICFSGFQQADVERERKRRISDAEGEYRVGVDGYDGVRIENWAPQ